jgi:arylsulfatase A-like enzyme
MLLSFTSSGPTMMRALLLLVLSVITAAAADKPNVMILFADDLGFADLGCYGGETQTPNLDSLAANGLRFTNGYNTARCWPSRASILSGYYPQQIRRDAIPGVNPSNGGQRPSWAKLLPAAIAAPGYRSYHSGKWHVDGTPLGDGFAHSYQLDDHDRNFNPKRHTEDGVALPQPNPDGSYLTTTAIAEHAIKCLKDHAANHAAKPFFSYVAFTCPHFPLQAHAADVAKYKDAFSKGWDHHRSARHERLKKMGLVTCGLSERTEGVPAWESLSPAQQTEWATRMSIHAAMIDRMDQEIGRILDQLKAMKVMDSTLIVFVSDNGASHERLVRGDGHTDGAPPGAFNTFQCLETGWANVANAPFRYSKMHVHEGGISTPWIMHWPQGIAAKNELRHTPVHLIDLPVTIAALAGGEWPNSPVKRPGLDITPLFKADANLNREPMWWSHQGNRALRVGTMKLVSKGEKGPWELYDLATDRAEQVNLSAKMPAKVKAMQAQWEAAWSQYQADALIEPPPKNKSGK